MSTYKQNTSRNVYMNSYSWDGCIKDEKLSKALMKDVVVEQILDKVDGVFQGKIKLDELSGSSTIRLSVGLVFGDITATNPMFGTDDELEAWAALDDAQKLVVSKLRPSYRNSLNAHG